MKLELRCLAVILLALVAGCQWLVAAAHDDVKAAPAAHPLRSGEPLVATPLPDGPMLKDLKEYNCDRWPIPTDRYALRASAEQLCVDVTMVFPQQPEVGANNSIAMTMFVATDTGQSQAPPLTATGPARKIAKCLKTYEGGTPEPEPVDVWVVDMTGCVANQGALTDRSKWAAVRIKVPAGVYDRARWNFN